MGCGGEEERVVHRVWWGRGEEHSVWDVEGIVWGEGEKGEVWWVLLYFAHVYKCTNHEQDMLTAYLETAKKKATKSKSLITGTKTGKVCTATCTLTCNQPLLDLHPFPFF